MSLTELETTRLALCELAIEDGLATFTRVGEALLTIRDNRLYRVTHATFADYCQERWAMTPRHANRLIGAFEVVEELGPIGPTPVTESQARELAPLRDEPEVMKEVWEDVVTEGKPTAAIIRARVRAARPDAGLRPDSRRKLTDAQIVEARQRHAAGETQRAIADDFGVPPNLIQRWVDPHAALSSEQRQVERAFRDDVQGVGSNLDALRTFSNIYLGRVGGEYGESVVLQALLERRQWDDLDQTLTRAIAHLRLVQRLARSEAKIVKLA